MDLGPWKSVVLTWASPPQSLLLIVMILDWRGFLLAGEPATELGASHLFSLDLTAPQPGMSIFADGETEAQRSDLAGTQGVVQLLLGLESVLSPQALFCLEFISCWSSLPQALPQCI